MGEDPALRLERELRALFPVLMADAQRRGETPAVTAERAVRVAMCCARPLLKAHDDHVP